MKIIRNRPFLFISQVLLAGYLPTQLTTAQAATAALEEAPPPWAARQEVQATQPLAAANPQALQAVATATPPKRQLAPPANTPSGNSIEQWYANRQGYVAQAPNSATALQAKATQGDLNAQYALALQLRQDPSPANIEQSLKLQEKAARAGHVEAQYGLGVLYSNGQYLPMDQRLANFWYTQAAKRGSEAAKLALNTGSSASPATPIANASVSQVPSSRVANENMLTANQPEPATAVMSEQDYANLDQAPVASSTADLAMAEPEATQAPTQGLAQAPRQARQSRSAPAPAQATQLAAPAVELADASQPLEGAAGAEGLPDAVEAESSPGDISVEHNQSKVDLGNMSVQQVIDTAQKGDMYAQLMLGALFEDGTDPAIPKNTEEAAKWYAKAARQGYPKAQHNLALLYEDGRGVPQSYSEAAKWYAKAAKAGFSEAQNNLAVLYIMGNGVKQDRSQAEKLLTAAVGQGNENARRNLQKLLEGAAS